MTKANTLPIPTREQVLARLWRAWRDVTFDPLPFSETGRLDEHLFACRGWQEIDLADIFCRIDRLFGLRPRGEWLDSWVREFEMRPGEATPRLTFGAVADFVLRRLQAAAASGRNDEEGGSARR